MIGDCWFQLSCNNEGDKIAAHPVANKNNSHRCFFFVFFFNHMELFGCQLLASAIFVELSHEFWFTARVMIPT